MGRIVIFDTPMNPKASHEVAHTGPFISFLLSHYPNGFPGPALVSFNLAKLRVENFDRELGESDVVTVSILPGVPAAFLVAYGATPFWSGVAAFAANAVIATALSFAVNKFFGPKGASTGASAIGSAGSAGTGSPTYDLNTPSNVARLGARIPVQHGKVLSVPDLASAPYSEYEGNQQYVRMLLCLGQGVFDVHDVLVAGTPVTSLPGVVTARVFSPDDHKQSFGMIQAISGVRENVYTSPAVSDQELTAALGGAFSSTGRQWSGQFNPGGPGGYSIFWLDTQAPEYAEAWRSGTPIWIVIASGANAGTYQVGFIVNSSNVGGNTAAWVYQKGHLAPGVDWASGSPTSDVMTLAYNIDGGSGSVIGPFAASPVGRQTEQLEYDVVFPSGVFKANTTTGRAESFTIAAEFLAEEIDDDGNTTGYAERYYYSDAFATTTRQRKTLIHAVKRGRYQVTATRTSKKSDRVQDQSAMHWTGLKSILGNTFGENVYGDTTIIAITAKATEGLASDAISRISVDSTRVLNGAPTRNPVKAFKDVILNQRYGGRRSVAELDTDVLDVLEGECESNGDYFDFRFETETNVWEAARATLQVQHVFPTMQGPVITVVEDKNYTVSFMDFDVHTIIKDSMTRTFITPNESDKDGVEVSYINADDGSELYALFPETSADSEQVALPGCRSYSVAIAYAEQRWRQVCLRRELISFDTEMEAHVIMVGVPINVSHPLLGDDPVMYIVNAVTPKDKYTATIAAHKHEPGVFL